MTLLIIGVIIWWDAHFFKLVMPGLRQKMEDRMGNGARGLMTVIILISLVMMVVGFRSASGPQIYTPPSWGGHLNNLMMLAAVIMLGMGNSKGRLRTWFRHPMLLGTIVWSIAHLLANGDLESIILFGGIGLWALSSIFLINHQEGPWTRPEPGPIAGDIKLVIIGLVLFSIIVAIHTWLGYSPFGAT
jgi:uncharacterized membrane protein